MSQQQKKSLYDFYQMSFDRFLAVVKKEAGHGAIKGATRKELALMLMEQDNFTGSSLNISIRAEEHYWQRMGSRVIFPESTGIIDNLINAKFQFDQITSIPLPCKSFIVAMPNGYKHNGVTIPSFMVSSYECLKVKEEIYQPYYKSLDKDFDLIIKAPDYKPGAIGVAITFRDMRHDQAYTRVFEQESVFPIALQCENLADFKKALGDAPDSMTNIDMDEVDFTIQYFAMRFVMAMGVYNRATDNDYLVDGFPGGSEPRMNFRNKDLPIKPMALSNKVAATGKDKGAKPSDHLRSWHFRNLKAEVYYQGEYANLPPGSRWVFIPEAMVGRKVDPMTQKADL
ncbi:hypothetical protein ACYPKM_03460 [Pseudomonas aeruginosa]